MSSIIGILPSSSDAKDNEVVGDKLITLGLVPNSIVTHPSNIDPHDETKLRVSKKHGR